MQQQHLFLLMFLQSICRFGKRADPWSSSAVDTGAKSNRHSTIELPSGRIPGDPPDSQWPWPDCQRPQLRVVCIFLYFMYLQSMSPNSIHNSTTWTVGHYTLCREILDLSRCSLGKSGSAVSTRAAKCCDGGVCVFSQSCAVARKLQRA